MILEDTAHKSYYGSLIVFFLSLVTLYFHFMEKSSIWCLESHEDELFSV